MMARLFGRQAKEQERRDELLSAYLDDQLSAEEQAHLEAQLATDPALCAELEALRRTIELVRDLPSASIPRNFIISQAMAGRSRPAPVARSRRAWAAPLLTVATTVVSLLFAIVLAGDLLLLGARRMAVAPETELQYAPVAESQMGTAAPQMVLEPSAVVAEAAAEKVAPSNAAATPSPPLLPGETPPEVLSEGEDFAEEEAGHREIAPEDTESPAPVAGAGGMIEEPTAPATSTVVAELAGRDAESTPDEVAEAAPPVVEGDAGERAEESEGWVPRGETLRFAPAFPWRVLEFVLGLTALALALATIRAWRIRRR
jgi:hypothetical protein